MPVKRKRYKGVLLVTIITGILCGVTAGAFLGLTRDLPQIQALEDFKPSAVTRVYSADQTLLTELFLEKRDPVPLDQIPQNLKAALLSVEDRHFYEHSGLALKGILRAFITNLRTRRYSQGASTLTQQLAKTLFLTPRKAIVRKLREAILAIQLERRYTKDEILELYLNQIYFGSGAYGVAAAARIYFNKSVQNLDLAECALLAGLPQAPSRYSPLVNRNLARKRRNIVLKQMYNCGIMNKAVYQKIIQQPVVTATVRDKGKNAPFFIAYIKKKLEKTIGANLLYKGGLTIYTTVSDTLQSAAEQAVVKGLTELDQRRQKIGLLEPTPQAALVALHPTTGGIMAMVGGRDFHQSQFNRAVSAKRQPGSAFKPIVFALAIERGLQQNQTVLDAPVVFQITAQDKDWQPQNFSQIYEGEISFRRALAKSKNIPAVRLIEKLGPTSVVQFANTLGITSEMNPNLSLALGSSEVHLIELTAAYAVFANRGKFIHPYGITEILSQDGKVIWRTKTEQRIAMSRTSAAIITNMLEAVIQEGTGDKARSLPGALAGKTGTTNDFRDALFVGYAPDIVVGVWVGNDDFSSIGPQETGAQAALPIWINFMQTALTNHVPQYFDIPDGVHSIIVDYRTGNPAIVTDHGAVKVLVSQDKKSKP